MSQSLEQRKINEHEQSTNLTLKEFKPSQSNHFQSNHNPQKMNTKGN